MTIAVNHPRVKEGEGLRRAVLRSGWPYGKSPDAFSNNPLRRARLQ